MWRSVTAAVLFACATAAANAQTQGASQRPRPRSAAELKAERELFRVEEEWTRALVRRDAVMFRRLVAPDFVYSDERGVITREQLIAEVTAGSDTVEAASNEDMVAHVYGDVGVVTGILVTSGRGKDGPFSHRYRYTDTWIKRGGRWICIAAQDYDIPRQ